MRRIAPRAAQAPCSARRRSGWVATFLVAASALCAGLSAAPADHTLGLPFTRSYSFEEIGDAARGARLGFDHLGRIAVMSSGSYSVLNDTTWIDLADKETDAPAMQRVFHGPDGRAYYGTFGSWGLVETTARGLLRPRSLLPRDHPKWVMSANFNEVVITENGVFFGGFSGAVYWERATGKQTFFEVAETSHIFAIGNAVFAASHSRGIQLLNLQTGAPETVLEGNTDIGWVDQVTAFSSSQVLISTIERRLLLFDGHELVPWRGPLAAHPAGRATAMQRLPDGSIAIAITGRGLYLLSPDGEILSAYTTPDYHRITDLASNEPGVLWIATETGIEKVLYESPLTVFGQRLGLPISWPQVVRWKDRIVVASGGRLYETAADVTNATERFHETKPFHLVPDQPTEEVWGLAAQGDHLLIGTSAGVMVRRADGRFEWVLSDINVARLVMVGDDLCYVIGVAQIAVLRRDGSRWAECASRVPGLRYPSIVHAASRSAWIELGANRAARVALRDGELQVRLFEHFPWATPKWVNIGVIGDTVILSGLPDTRLFFDEISESFVDSPELRQLFRQAPHPITRLRRDEGGTIWAVHDQGLMMFEREGEGYGTSPASFGRINDRFPLIQLLPDGDVWLATGQSLYHVDRRFAHAKKPQFQPALVSIEDGRTNRKLASNRPVAGSLGSLPFTENSLVFRFFAGSYASRQPPLYEFNLHRDGDRRAVVGNGSVLTLTDLREGAYRLEVRVTDSREIASEPLAIDFSILPPWYRTWYAYTLYALGAAGLVYGLLRWSVQRTRSRNFVLEKLVAERTDELRIAMQQLNEETRNAATVAERDRLAGEIHDSLQQGLSGLMLHLDATLKLPDLSADVRSRLSVARNMVSFTRHEVQHAVWDMETPLLEGTELGDALKKITALIGPGEARVEIAVTGTPTELSSSTKHHLLRIGQEAITNAVRHSAARTISISLVYEPTQVSLTIADDGNGFIPNDVLTKGIGHFGLRGLRGRAAKIGGDLQIQSAPGHGTSVRITVLTANPALTHASDR